MSKLLGGIAFWFTYFLMSEALREPPAPRPKSPEFLHDMSADEVDETFNG